MKNIMKLRSSQLTWLAVMLVVALLCPAEALAQDGGGSAKSPLIGYVLMVLGLLLGWTPLIRPSRRKKKFSFET